VRTGLPRSRCGHRWQRDLSGGRRSSGALRWAIFIAIVRAQRHRLTGGLQHRLGAGEHIDQRRLTQPEQGGAPHRIGGHQALAPKAGKVFGHGGLRQPDSLDKVDHPRRPRWQPSHDGQPSRITQRTKQCRSRSQLRPRHFTRHRSHRHIAMLSFAGFRVVIDNRALPVVDGQPGEDIAEQLRRICELAGNILGMLVGIPIVHNPLVTSRRRTVRPIHPARREHPFSLHEQHVA
jgi:hypothetical protein